MWLSHDGFWVDKLSSEPGMTNPMSDDDVFKHVKVGNL